METTLCWTGEKKNVRVRYLNSLGRETRERPQNSISNFWIVYILACRGEQFFSFTIIRNHGFYIHGIMLWSFFLTNFLVLHCASPSAHTIATSKVAVIFTSRLKRGIYGSFCSPYAFNSDFDNSTRLKGRLSWNSLQSPRAKWSFEAEIAPLSFCDQTSRAERWPPILICVFYSL